MKFGFLENISPDRQMQLRVRLETGWIANGKCWEWTGSLNKGGYGILGKIAVHRLSYALFVSDFRRANFICHHCDNPKCYRPDHLYVGNSKSNGADASKRNRVVSRSIYKKDLVCEKKANITVRVEELSCPAT